MPDNIDVHTDVDLRVFNQFERRISAVRLRHTLTDIQDRIKPLLKRTFAKQVLCVDQSPYVDY
jgi:hypothetical protein